MQWNAQVLGGLLKQVVAARLNRPQPPNSVAYKVKALEKSMHPDIRQGLILDEVTEFIRLPRFDASRDRMVTGVSLGSEVVSQLQQYVATIAEHYPSNPCTLLCAA